MSYIVFSKYGTKKYYNDMGQLHREGSPAVQCIDGESHWFLNDELHREDGPATEYANGDQEWYQYGKLHRTDGPALRKKEGNNFIESWYVNGKLHREDGPATMWGFEEFWYLEGIRYSKEEHNKRLKSKMFW